MLLVHVIHHARSQFKFPILFKLPVEACFPELNMAAIAEEFTMHGFVI